MIRKLSIAVGSIASIGLAVKNMGNLTLNNVFLYGLILLFSYLFIKGIFNLGEEKTKNDSSMKLNNRKVKKSHFKKHLKTI